MLQTANKLRLRYRRSSPFLDTLLPSSPIRFEFPEVLRSVLQPSADEVDPSLSKSLCDAVQVSLPPPLHRIETPLSLSPPSIFFDGLEKSFFRQISPPPPQLRTANLSPPPNRSIPPISSVHLSKPRLAPRLQYAGGVHPLFFPSPPSVLGGFSDRSRPRFYPSAPFPSS